MKNIKWDSKYLYSGITALLVIFCCIVFYMCMKEWLVIKAAVMGLFSILAPFIWGFVIAYLLCPLMKFFQKNIFSKVALKVSKTKRAQFSIARGLSILASVIVAWVMIVILCWLIIPSFYISIKSIVAMIPEYSKYINSKTLELIADFPELEAVVHEYVDKAYLAVSDWLSNDLQPKMTGIMTVVTTSLRAVLMVIVNILIGFIVSCYLLYNKEHFGANLRRVLYSIFSTEHVDSIVKSFRFFDSVFMGFLGGKLIDSAIIGVICYVGCTMLGLPYAVLISVVIGVTNIIPYFGPFIGAVPCGFIIFMTSPLQCLIFSIFVLALQQFDGNILGPRILGNSVGISGFWVMFSILVGGGLFGFGGMLIGVPVFVIASTGLNLLIESRLKNRGLPIETAEYMDKSELEDLE